MFPDAYFQEPPVISVDEFSVRVRPVQHRLDLFHLMPFFNLNNRVVSEQINQFLWRVA
jgi:hypothetical protein